MFVFNIYRAYNIVIDVDVNINVYSVNRRTRDA